MRNIFIIMKKELRRFFKDKRMLASLILPGLMIFLIYSLMGSFMGSNFSMDENHEYIVCVLNKPNEIILPTELKVDYDYNEDNKTLEFLQTELKEEKLDLIIEFDSDFTIKEGTVVEEELSSVKLYQNSASVNSSYCYSIFNQYFNKIGNKPVFNLTSQDLATNEDTSKMIITMIMPFLLTILLFSGCMGVTTESIAGEKERGTIATLLITPVKRSHIAIGKILALSITAVVSALSSFIGLIASLPNLLEGQNISMAMYGPLTYISIFIVMLITVAIFVVLLSIISTFAKSVKEAAQYAAPIMVLVTIVGISSMLSTSSDFNNFLYLIPIFNSIKCMGLIFNGSTFDFIPFLFTIISNVVLFGIGIFVLTKMFNSEKIMYNK